MYHLLSSPWTGHFSWHSQFFREPATFLKVHLQIISRQVNDQRNGIISGIWYVVSSLFGVDVNIRWFRRTTFWGKTAVMVIWLFMVTILIFAYKNVLLSTLITTTFEKPIDNVDDMLKHKVYTFFTSCCHCFNLGFSK